MKTSTQNVILSHLKTLDSKERKSFIQQVVEEHERLVGLEKSDDIQKVAQFVESLGYSNLSELFGEGKYVARKRTRKTYNKSFKIAVCDYYSNHTKKETLEKYPGISYGYIWRWRKEYGYPLKQAGSHPAVRRSQRPV